MQQPSKPRTAEESFGHAVAMLRGVRQLSQREFASRLTERGMPVDASAVSRIEKGTRSVRLVEALMIAEVLEVDLDFLISGSKTPSQEFQTLRRRTDAALRALIDPVVEASFALWETEYHLAKNPELLASLSDPELSPPASPDEYLTWVADRVERWQVPEDDYVITDSEEHAARLVNVITRLVEMHVGTKYAEAEGGQNGFDPEEA